jgi:thiol-disulfide isomerase/thioredoxin
MKVLKIGAEWCPGCIIMRPRWKKIENENHWLETEYFDFDKSKEIVEKYNIDDVLPAFIFLDNNGVEIDRVTGEISEKDILDLINKYKNK